MMTEFIEMAKEVLIPAYGVSFAFTFSGYLIIQVLRAAFGKGFRI